MIPAKVDVIVGQLCYAGNGGYSSILPQIGDWWAKVYHEIMCDDRIGRLAKENLDDTPAPKNRNRLLHQAVAGKFDIVLMIDSDNEPDLYVGYDSAAKPFWKSSFDFAYRRLTQGLPTCIGAPYCGPPPHPVNGGEENPYVFKWKNWESDNPHYSGAEVVAYDRTEAALMTGISPAAALPTGLMLLTVNLLECIKPPYFRYEWKDAWEDQKASTEDVYFTRNIAMAGRMKWGAPVVFANWDSWAGHHKPKCVGKPVVLRTEQICETFAEAVRNNFGSQDRMMFVNPEMSDAEIESLKATLRDSPDQAIVPCSAPQLPGEVEMRNGRHFQHLGWRSSIKDRYALEMVVQQLPDDRDLFGAEIGSWVGDSAVTILNTRDRIFLSCVDTFDGSKTDTTGDIANDLKRSSGNEDIVRKTFDANMKPYGNRFHAYQEESEWAVQHYDDGDLDFIYIDAGHSYGEVNADIQLWLPKLKHESHAIIAGHDYNDPGFPGVKQAVDEAFGNKVQYHGHVWYVKPYAVTAIHLADEYDEMGPEEPSPTLKVHRESWPQLVSDIDYQHLEEFLQVWNQGGEPKRMVYVGEPDFDTLDLMARYARGGRVFCVKKTWRTIDESCDLAEKLSKSEGRGVSFVSVDDIATADFWSNDEADFVFVHHTAAILSVLENALMILKDDGILAGTKKDRKDVFAALIGQHVEQWNDGTLWAIFPAKPIPAEAATDEVA